MSDHAMRSEPYDRVVFANVTNMTKDELSTVAHLARIEAMNRVSGIPSDDPLDDFLAAVRGCASSSGNCQDAPSRNEWGVSTRHDGGGRRIKGWHFLADDYRLRYGDGRRVRLGETIKVDCKPRLCASGLHVGYRVVDALRYAQGYIACYCELGGDIVKGDDKAAGTERTVLWWVNAERVLHEFACRVAEDALQAAGVEDPRIWNAIKVKRAWMDGRASDAELVAARDAARYVPWVAERFAERFVPWVAERYVPWVAERYVPWVAERVAAGYVPLVADRVAPWVMARDAAWEDARKDAAWGSKNKRLTSMLVAARDRAK